MAALSSFYPFSSKMENGLLDRKGSEMGKLTFGPIKGFGNGKWTFGPKGLLDRGRVRLPAFLARLNPPPLHNVNRVAFYFSHGHKSLHIFFISVWEGFIAEDPYAVGEG